MPRLPRKRSVVEVPPPLTGASATVSADPVKGSDVATKAYVDRAILMAVRRSEGGLSQSMTSLEMSAKDFAEVADAEFAANAAASIKSLDTPAVGPPAAPVTAQDPAPAAVPAPAEAGQLAASAAANATPPPAASEQPVAVEAPAAPPAPAPAVASAPLPTPAEPTPPLTMVDIQEVPADASSTDQRVSLQLARSKTGAWYAEQVDA